MAPNFLSKFVKPSGTLGPEQHLHHPRSRTTSEVLPRGRTISDAKDSNTTTPNTSQLQTDVQVVLTTDASDSPIQPSTPGSLHRADSPHVNQTRSASLTRSDRSKATPISTPRKAATDLLDMPHTTSPTEAEIHGPGAMNGLRMDLGLSASASMPAVPSTSAVGGEGGVKKKTSTRSLRSLNSLVNGVTSHRDGDDVANTQESAQRRSMTGAPSIPPMQPIVESPTSESTSFSVNGGTTPIAGMYNFEAASSNGALASSSTSTSLSHTHSLHARGRTDSDAVSIASTGAISQSGGKKMPWRRSGSETSSSKKRKPTGLASAIAASGLAMANPAVNMEQSIAQIQPISKARPPQSPPRSPPPQGSRRNSTPRSRQTSASYASMSNGEENGGGGDSYTDDMESDSSDALDFGDDDIPVTGFAVASVKRNADFHELFPSVPEGDYLIEDYGCALQREILIQGRFYISENHICFHANIFGWVTDLTVPICEILSIEKKMTAFVIPNAIQITTRTSKYTFASFLARDTTYDVIHNIWRLARPVDGDSLASGGASPRISLEDRDPDVDGSEEKLGRSAVELIGVSVGPKTTQCRCGKEQTHYREIAMDTVFPGTPEKIYNLMFASGFIKDFMREEQKLKDLQISDWCPDPDTGLLSRNMSYIKPLFGGVGPRQTKCELKDETLHCDFDDYVTTLTTTRTPDVPSGGAFSVKTRTCIMWCTAASTRVTITTVVEWTGRSFIKSIIEKSALDGQKSYQVDLERSMRAYIANNRTEFIPEGLDLSAVAAVEPIIATIDGTRALTPTSPNEPISEEEANKRREHERNQRATQWAFDTIMGAWNVAKQSTSDALDLVSEAWEQSSSTTILWFVIVVLVFSNLWTLVMVGRREDVGRRKEMVKIDEQKKWVQTIVAALWEERAIGPAPGGYGPPMIRATDDWRGEMEDIVRTLDAAEERLRRLRRSLQDLD